LIPVIGLSEKLEEKLASVLLLGTITGIGFQEGGR